MNVSPPLERLFGASRWLSARVPQSRGPSWLMALAWGVGTFLISGLVALPAWLVINADPVPDSATLSWGLAFGSLLLAPAVETVLMVAAIRDARRTRSWEVALIAALFAVAHLPFRAHVLFFLPQFAAFMVFGHYLRWRRSHAGAAVSGAEVFCMHAFHNALALAVLGLA